MVSKWIGLGIVLAAGCNNGGPTGGGMPAAPIVQMVVDADRDGVVDAKATGDVMYRNMWDKTHGAIFLANVDDDDADTKVDATDEVVNGDADALDLARIKVVAWPDAPATAAGTITIEPADAVHLFRHAADGSWNVFHSGDALAAADLVAGLELGIEAIDFANPKWDGTVALTLSVTQPDAMGMAAVAGTDKVMLKVAPLVLQSNLASVDRIYAGMISDSGSPPFLSDLHKGAMLANVPVVEVNSEDDRYIDPNTGVSDQWTQDIFEVGFTNMPGAGGKPQGMFVVIRTPVPDRVAADYTEDEMLAPDFGWVWKHSDPYNRDPESASLDSFGNLDAIPPYDHGSSHYPLGRVLMGSIPKRHVDDALRDFLNAQVIQGPNFYIDTSWLLVGHLDEVLSFVKASTPRGYKLLMASPARARKLLMDLVTKDPQNGNVLVFAGRKWVNDQGKEVPAQVTITALLADADRMAASQLAQTKIDVIRAALQKEMGLADDEIVDIPVLFEGTDIGNGTLEYVAYTPGLVNLLHVDGILMPPAAHGPSIGGMDALAADFVAQTTPLGDTTSWVEDWDLYHRLDGEVHCGSNVTRKVPAKSWWEVLP